MVDYTRLPFPVFGFQSAANVRRRYSPKTFDRQVNDALRNHLQVFTPAQIRAALDRIGSSQKEVAERLGIAEATLSRWLNETQIQAKSLDRYLRVFFAFPQVREALTKETLNPDFGTRDTVTGNTSCTAGQSAMATGAVGY